VALVQPRIFRIIRVAVTVALALSIAGAVEASNANASDRSTASTLRKVGAILLIGSFGVIAFLHFLYWQNVEQIFHHRRTLLVGISCALPFMAVRVVYSVLSGFSPFPSFTSQGIVSDSSSPLAKFNSFSGSWQIYLVMSLVMEFCAVLVYLTVGTLVPVDRDDSYAAGNGPKAGEHLEMYGNGQRQGYVPQQPAAAYGAQQQPGYGRPY